MNQNHMMFSIKSNTRLGACKIKEHMKEGAFSRICNKKLNDVSGPRWVIADSTAAHFFQLKLCHMRMQKLHTLSATATHAKRRQLQNNYRTPLRKNSKQTDAR